MAEEKKYRSPDEVYHNGKTLREILDNRPEHPGRIDLTEADLHDVNLKKVDLYRADLTDANLRGANLDSAHLDSVDFVRANISKASLRGAEVCANLHEADLSGADLFLANFEGANLYGANLCGVTFNGAKFKDAELGGVTYDRNGEYFNNRLQGAYSNPRFLRFARDQEFLEELHECGGLNALIYWIWNIFADCPLLQCGDLYYSRFWRYCAKNSNSSHVSDGRGDHGLRNAGRPDLDPGHEAREEKLRCESI